jgi:hypothetical protein
MCVNFPIPFASSSALAEVADDEDVSAEDVFAEVVSLVELELEPAPPPQAHAKIAIHPGIKYFFMTEDFKQEIGTKYKKYDFIIT